MNDETPFTTHGDEPVEARIVSWVLGEASAFEAAELERLCEERPELLVFRRRMRALHGLLTEAEAAQSDEGWKLPPEKRKALDEIFGEVETADQNLGKENRIRHSGRRAILAIAACVVITFVVLQFVYPVWVKRDRVGETSEAVTYMASSEADQEAQAIALGKAIRDQEDQVEERRKVLATIARTKGIIYRGNDSLFGSSGVDEDQGAKNALDAFHELEQEKLQIESQLSSLQKYDSDQLMTYASGLDLPDNSIRQTYPQYLEAKRQLEGLKINGLDDDHPTVKAQKENLDAMKHQLDEGAVNLRETLSAQLDLATNRLKSVEVMKDESREDAIKRGLDAQDYVDARREFEADQELLQAMKLKQIEMTIESAVAGNRESGGVVEMQQKQPSRSEAPALPSSSMAKVVAANEASLSAIPAPDLDVRSQAVAFGDTDDFGSGWGGSGGAVASKKTKGADDRMRLAGRADHESKPLDVSDFSPTNVAPGAGRTLKVAAEPGREMGAYLRRSQEPAPELARFTEETPAAEDPYSTFSLNISDASFRVAQAALAKGEQPDPAGIKVEQFYNAVDYGDPAAAVGEPVAVNIEQSAHPVIPGRNLVRIALKTAAAGRSAAQPLRLTLLVDQSGSMVREDRRAAMDKALTGLSELLTEHDLVTVIGFSRTPRLLADGMPGNQAGKLAELANQSASEGGTNLEEAIKLGEQLADRRRLAGAQNRIVLFTDGAANLGNANPERLADQVKELRQKGIAFDIAGIAADGLNDELLGELARNGNGRYYVVGNGVENNFAQQLAGAFRPAAGNVKVQVRFNPERVARYKLIGFEKDRLKTEDFRNDTVDAAELAAEEAGVAIYQIEPLSEGNGELGEVSVRFRDTASDQMVERSWTIPHDANAPALDRATPSMQLAVLSMLAGEKLKGGPPADAIDFKRLAATAAAVRRFYGTTGRVGEMLRMVDALK